MIDLDPVFNDLSCKPVAADKYEASRRMVEFVRVLNEFPYCGLGRSLRTTGDFYGLKLTGEYSISDWMYDPGSPQVERELLTTLATKTPVLVGLDATICEAVQSSEASCTHGSSEALLICHLINLPLISLGHDSWGNSHIGCSISEIDDEGEVQATSQRLVNFSKPAHFRTHATWVEQRKKTNLYSLKDAWKAREQLFPHLCFAPEVEKQLDKIPRGTDLSAQLLDRLFDLERVASLGQTFSNIVFRTTCSASSNTALEKYKSAYSFKDDSGKVHLCGWHLKMQDGNRIYFADLGGRYLIGHIGEHLPTKKFN